MIKVRDGHGEVFEHKNAVCFETQYKEQLCVFDREGNTIAIYSAGNWVSATIKNDEEKPQEINITNESKNEFYVELNIDEQEIIDTISSLVLSQIQNALNKVIE